MTRWALRFAVVLLIPAAVLLLLAAIVAIPGAGLACAALYAHIRRPCSADRSTRGASLRYLLVSDGQQRAATQPAEQGLRPDRGREGTELTPFALSSRPPCALIEWPMVERKGKWGDS